MLMPMNEEFQQKVKALPIRQQVGLYTILCELLGEDRTIFSTAEFANKTHRYFLVDNVDAMGNILGGILSSLVRNGMVERVAGGGKRESVWLLAPELHRHAKEYKQLIFPVYTYWEGKKKS